MSKALADSPIESSRHPQELSSRKLISKRACTHEESNETIIEAFVEGMVPEEKEDERNGEFSSSPATREWFQRRVRVTDAEG
jgi:hypothetical protein